MRGIFFRLIAEWSGEIVHKDKNPENATRYEIGRRRWRFLKANMTPFAYEQRKGPEEVAAFLIELDEDDLDASMPQETRYEYICGSVKNDQSVIFAYIWFESLEDAVNYATRKNMTIEGGWK